MVNGALGSGRAVRSGAGARRAGRIGLVQRTARRGTPYWAHPRDPTPRTPPGSAARRRRISGVFLDALERSLIIEARLVGGVLDIGRPEVRPATQDERTDLVGVFKGPALQLSGVVKPYQPRNVGLLRLPLSFRVSSLARGRWAFTERTSDSTAPSGTTVTEEIS